MTSIQHALGNANRELEHYEHGQTEGTGSNVYLVRVPKGRLMTMGIVGPHGGQGDVALVEVDEFLRVLINVIGPQRICTAMAKHKEAACSRR